MHQNSRKHDLFSPPTWSDAPTIASGALLLVVLSIFGGCSGGPPDGSPETGEGRSVPPPPADHAATFVKGSAMRGANGILFGPDGLLYVASVVTPGVLALDPQSGEIVQRLGPEENATAPDDLAFGPDGALYWTNISFGTIGKRAVDGSTSVIADLGPGVNPITFSDDGRLFVSQCFMDTRLFEIDPTGDEEPRLIRDDLGPNCGLNGMDWGPDGKLYGPRWFRGEVARVDVDTGALETVADGFAVPAAVKFDSAGTLHVLDAMAGIVVRLNADGSRDEVAHLPQGLDNLAFSASGSLFVSSFADGAIWEVLGPEENRVVSAPGVNMPGGLALLGDRLFVADFFALRTLDARTGAELEAVRDVIGFTDLGSSMSVHADGDGLILTSWFDNQVRSWNPQTNELIASYPVSLPIDALRWDDRIVATTWGIDGAGSVVAIAPERSGSGQASETLVKGLDGPAGLALDAAGDLYITERRGGRLLRLARQAEKPEVLAEGLRGPEGVAVVAGQVFLVEADAGRVLHWKDLASLPGTAPAILAEDLALHVQAQGVFPETMLFNGIAVRHGDAGFEVFVSGDRDNVIYRWQFAP